MGPLEVLQGIYAVAMIIHQQVEQAKANKAQCKRLGARIQTLVDILKGFESDKKIPDNQHFLRALQELHALMNEIARFITQFSQKHWAKKLLLAGIDKEEFAAFNKHLEEAMSHLNLGLNAQQIMNRHADKADQEADLSFLKDQQSEILRLNQESQEKLDQIGNAQKERDAILAKQLASMRAQFEAVAIGKPVAKPLIDPQFCVPYFDLIFKRVIGKGSFGTVYEGTWKTQPVAIKTVEGPLTAEVQAQFVREVQIISRLRSRYITQFYATCIEPARYALVMEYMAKGSLHDMLPKQQWTPEEKYRLAMEIVQGVAYLHQQNVIHRDLKSANVLLDEDNHAKLADFGLSKTGYATVVDIHTESTAAAWLAPELLQRKSAYTPATDMYSVGMILWELWTGKTPWAGLKESEIISRVIKGERERLPDTMPPAYARLIQQCWQTAADKRPTAVQVLHQLEESVPRAPSPTGEVWCEQGMAYEKAGKWEQAFQCYRRSAEKDFFRGHTNLGNFYLQGLGGVLLDKPKAADCFRRGAALGHVRAMHNLAQMLEYGDGIPMDKAEALHFYGEGANKGDSHMQTQASRLEALLANERTATVRPRAPAGVVPR